MNDLIDLNELYVCEYSARQKVFHIAQLTKALQMNADGIIRGYGLDFIPFALVKDYAEADSVCDKMLELMKENRRKVGKMK
ncbi:MAG: hypothetical protein IKF90_16095 [Parasporobacterium sp.]|nr:hypothetical protein [Parasporobacterium sp.]